MNYLKLNFAFLHINSIYLINCNPAEKPVCLSILRTFCPHLNTQSTNCEDIGNMWLQSFPRVSDMRYLMDTKKKSTTILCNIIRKLISTRQSVHLLAYLSVFTQWQRCGTRYTAANLGEEIGC